MNKAIGRLQEQVGLGYGCTRMIVARSGFRTQSRLLRLGLQARGGPNPNPNPNPDLTLTLTLGVGLTFPRKMRRIAL